MVGKVRIHSSNANFEANDPTLDALIGLFDRKGLDPEMFGAYDRKGADSGEKAKDK